MAEESQGLGSKSSDKQPEFSGIKPLQSISYSDKIADDYNWGKQNIRYFVDAADFRISQGGRLQNMQNWYNAYNNRIDESVYNYVTNPMNTTNALYKNFPARIRSYNILRPSIDLLIGEYSKRAFRFDVVNVDGDDVFDSFSEKQYELFKKNLEQRWINAKAEYNQPTNHQPQKNLPDPVTVIEDLNTNFKDEKAIKGYKSLKYIEFNQKLKEKFKYLFKDFLIAGETETLKFAKRSDLEYSDLSPLWVDWGKSPLTKNIEDGDHGVVKFRVTVSDLVDMFYEELKFVHLKQLEENENVYRKRLFTNITGSDSLNEDMKERLNKVDLYYCCWKSRKKIGWLTYTDPATLETLKDVVDEDYVLDKEAGETVEWEWVNEVWEGWRINDDIFVGIQPVVAQRNELNNFSECKLPLNGRRFSDRESQNVSVFSLGMPYQIMYIIMMYRIELCIARSHGKITIIDSNIIPDGGELGQDKWLYESKALGFSFVDFNQDGVNNAVNAKWAVLDLSLYEDIKQLINIAHFYKDSWEELLGINRQRKGETGASEGLGVTEEAVFRSSIISDIIFSTFDEFIESELQGLLDLTRYAWIDGKKGYYRNDDGRMEMLNVDPNESANAALGVFVDSSGRMTEKFKLLIAQVNAAAQRKDIKMSTVADMIFTDSYAELRAKLKQAEEIEVRIIQANQQNEHEQQQELQKMKEDYLRLEKFLENQNTQLEEDRLDNREFIKGEVLAAVKSHELANTPGEPLDIAGIQETANKRLTEMERNGIERQKITSNEKIEQMKNETKKEEIAASLKNKVVGEK